MDIIHQCLSLAPVPYLLPAFSVLRFIWSSIQQVQASKWQLEALAQSIAQLLETLNEEYRAGRLLQAKTSTPLKNLRRYVDHGAVDHSSYLHRSGYWRKYQNSFRRKHHMDFSSFFSPKI